MEAIQTNSRQWLRGAGILGLYGGSVAIALALMVAGWSGGAMSQLAGVGTGAVTNALIGIMSVVGGMVRQI
jgi:hypothetical protein